MKNLLLTTALVATTGAAFASNDNFATQLAGIEKASQCQNHFDKDAPEVSANINHFEFCVWYLNNNREAFFRDINWYGLLPSGDIISTRDYNFTSKNKAEKAIKAAIEVIVEANSIDVELPDGSVKSVNKEAVLALIEAVESKDVAITALNAEVTRLTDELTKVATDAEMDIAEKVAMIETISTELATASAAVTSLTSANADLKAVKADLEADVALKSSEIKALEKSLKDAQEATIAAVKAHVDEIAQITAQLGFNQGEINVLVEIQKIQDANTQLAADLQKEIDDRAAERTMLDNQISDLMSDIDSLDVKLSAETTKYLDEIEAHAKTSGKLAAETALKDAAVSYTHLTLPTILLV